MSPDTRRRLETFVEKADKIERSRYVRHVVTNGGWKLSFNWVRGQGGTMEDNFPDAEAVDALMLTARMFLQDNDPISIRNIARILDDPGVSDEWKDLFREFRAELNAGLDRPAVAIVEGRHYTEREIFEIYLYGELAHTQPEKAAIVARWRGGVEHLVKGDFHSAVLTLVEAARRIAAISRLELAGESIPLNPESAAEGGGAQEAA